MSPPPTPLPPQQPPSSAETVGSNPDLLTEILTHLPTLPLLRFKTVNKQFHSLISHPSFSLLHTLRHINHPSSALFYLPHHHTNHPFSSSSSSLYHLIPFNTLSTPPPPPFDILQSTNGLLLCASGTTFFVSNPTLNSFAPVPNLTHHRHHLLRPVLDFNLAFDPSRWDRYFLVRVSPFMDEEGSYSIDVYDSCTRQWRVGVVDPFTAPFDVEFSRGVYWEGRLHWLSHTQFTPFFDFEAECVGTLPLPSLIDGGSYVERFRYFGESCGHLHLIEIRTNSVQEFEVLELDKENKVEWFVKYRVNLDVLGRGFESDMFHDHVDRFGRGFRYYGFSVLAVVRDNVRGVDVDADVDDSIMLLSIPGKVISYNFRTKVSRLVCCVVDESDKLFPFRGHTAFQYIESLYRL